MSNIYTVAFVLNNEIDTTFINKTFNILPEKVGATESLYSETLFSYLKYHGNLHISGEAEKIKYCYSIENGYCLFRSAKYAFYNSDKKVLISRSGDQVGFSIFDSTDTAEQLPDTAVYDAPPVQELKKVFDYILSFNEYFYIFCYMAEIDQEIKDVKVYLERLIKERELYEYKCSTAIDFLINLFDTERSNHSPERAFNVILRVVKEGYVSLPE